MIPLSYGQERVLALMAEGLSNEAIAGVLGTSLRQVEKHCRQIFAKLDLPIENKQVSRRVKAVLWYREQYLGEPALEREQGAEHARV